MCAEKGNYEKYIFLALTNICLIDLLFVAQFHNEARINNARAGLMRAKRFMSHAKEPQQIGECTLTYLQFVQITFWV